jgi:hypothetical protein
VIACVVEIHSCDVFGVWCAGNSRRDGQHHRQLQVNRYTTVVLDTQSCILSSQQHQSKQMRRNSHLPSIQSRGRAHRSLPFALRRSPARSLELLLGSGAVLLRLGFTAMSAIHPNKVSKRFRSREGGEKMKKDIPASCLARMIAACSSLVLARPEPDCYIRQVC